MNIFENINRLAAYGLKTGLIQKDDLIFVKNQLLAMLALDGFEMNHRLKTFQRLKLLI